MEYNDGVEVLSVEKEEAAGSPDEKGSRWTEAEAADVELELPHDQPLQELLSRLSAGSMSPDSGLVDSVSSLDGREFGRVFGDFFRPEVRLKVLEAVGNCRTLRRFESYQVQKWNLTASEWKTLMIPMQLQPNSHLEEISISAFGTAQEEELIGPYLAKLISQSHKLSKLELVVVIRGESSTKFAAEIGSGVRARAQAHDQLMELRLNFCIQDPGQEEEVLLIAVDIISSAPKLEILEIQDFIISRPCHIRTLSPFMSGKEALAHALRGLARLKRLKMNDVKSEMVDAVAEVYTGTSSNSVLENLRLAGDMPGVTAEALALFIRGKITTITLDISVRPHIDQPFLTLRPDEWQDIGRCLFQAPTLVKFELNLHMFGSSEFSEICTKSLENGLLEFSNTRSPLLHIFLDVDYNVRFAGSTSVEGNNFGALSIVKKALDSNCVKIISLHYCPVETTEFRSFVDELASNSSVEELRMSFCGSSSKDGWTYLFSRLRNNTSIKALDLSYSQDLDDISFRDVIDLLQVNYTLKSIRVDGTVWREDGKMALLQAALQRNTKQERYFSDLREAQLRFDGAKAGRIFFCGAAFAGKTTLKVTMMETMGKKSKSESVYNWKKKVGKLVPKFRRTQGIEVELLCGDQSATISIWDLAGQEIFRALHHLLFPRINQACIFVFVFNPFQGEGKNRTLKPKIEQAFAQELRSWLRFVVSNSQITGRILPQMLVIITHKDKLEIRQTSLNLMITELKKIVKKLQQEYKDVVNLCPDPVGDGITDTDNDHDPLMYQVNAKAKTDVEPIKALLLRSMKEMLERKSPRVPRVCSELVSHLLGRPAKVQRSPLWSSEQLYKFCSTHTPLLEDFAVTEKRGRRVLHAVASCMHDAGAICMTPSAMEEFADSPSNNPKKSVVVDLNWLTQNFLGKIINHEHRSDVQSGRPSTSDPSDVSIGFDGFIEWQELFDLVVEIIKANPRQAQAVNKDALKELLFELDLCYHIGSKNGPGRVFMPLLFGASKGMASNNLHWSAEGSDHFGFRVQCLDQERTSLSAGFFPRFQIHLRKQMGALGVIDENFVFSRYHVEIRHNGCLIFVEIDQSAENHIDIMVRFSEKPRDWAMEFVEEYVVRDLVQFGASEKGCPGMQLLVLILRTHCVKNLTPRHLRTEAQAVAREELKKRFHDDVESQLEKDGMESDSLFGYLHTWPEVRTTTSSSEVVLPLEFEKAQTLLSSKDVNDVLVVVRSDHEDFWENLQELRQVSSRLNDPSIKLELPVAQPVVEDTFIQRTHEQNPLALIKSRPSFRTRHDVSDGESLKLVVEGMHHLGERLDKGMHHLEERIVASHQKIMASLKEVKCFLGNFKSDLDEMRSRMSHLTSKVDEIIRYKRSKEAHIFPRRPYFTTRDVSRAGTVKASLLFGKAVRIHFMCEARHQPHFVDKQAGLELHFEKEDRFSKSMRVLSVVSLHMIWVLLKVGAQVTAGLGSVVPTISSLGKGTAVGISAASNLVLDRLELEVRENLPFVKDQKYVEEAWCCLRDYLAPNFTKDKCASLFRLHLVKYRNSDDPFAWLCESCMLRGRRNRLLETET